MSDVTVNKYTNSIRKLYLFEIQILPGLLDKQPPRHICFQKLPAKKNTVQHFFLPRRSASILGWFLARNMDTREFDQKWSIIFCVAKFKWANQGSHLVTDYICVRRVCMFKTAIRYTEPNSNCLAWVPNQTQLNSDKF